MYSVIFPFSTFEFSGDIFRILESLTDLIIGLLKGTKRRPEEYIIDLEPGIFRL